MLEKTKSKHRLRQERNLYHRLDRAEADRQRKLDDGKLSLPSGMGKLVITVSRQIDSNDKNFSPRQQLDIVHELADRLKEERNDLHQAVEIETADEIGLKFNMMDPDVTDIILIGHGNLGDYHLNQGGHFGWQDAAKSAEKLKQGSIEQRTCGHFAHPEALTVPLGTFAVSDQTNLIAAVGEEVRDIRQDHLFRPVYAQPNITIEDIVAINELHGVDVPVRPISK